MPTEEKWDEYFESVRRYLATDKLDRDEINYKLEIGRKLARARRALLAGKQEWFDLLRPALSGKGNPIDWRDADLLKKWLNVDREVGGEVLRTVWSDGDLNPGAIRAFCERFPSDAGPGRTATRLRTISVLLMARGPTAIHHTWRRVSNRLSGDWTMAGRRLMPTRKPPTGTRWLFSTRS